MEASIVDLAISELFPDVHSKPFTVSMAGRIIDAERIILRSEDGEIPHRVAVVGNGCIQDLAKATSHDRLLRAWADLSAMPA